MNKNQSYQYHLGQTYLLEYTIPAPGGVTGYLGESHLSGQRVQRTKSKSPKGLQLEVWGPERPQTSSLDKYLMKLCPQ